MSTAAVLSIGDELVLGQIVERNGGWLSAELLKLGLMVKEHRTVADDRVAIRSALKELASKAALVVVTGGLGPTDDDLSREALADALETELEEDGRALVHLLDLYRRRGRPMPAMNRKQALRPVGTQCIDNPHGTAPGIAARLGNAEVFLLPGPPNEMRPMFRDVVAPAVLGVTARAGGLQIATASVHSCGMPESAAAELIRPLMERGANPLVGTTASGAIVTARIRAMGNAAKDGALERAVQEVERAWAPYAFGRDGLSLPAALGEVLHRERAMLAVAESCSGGGLGAFVTSVPGSSRWFAGGFITYSNELKRDLCGVPQAMLAKHGAVSDEVARALAQGAAEKCNCRFGLSITGVAGPDGGSAERPVGLVWVGLCDRGRGQSSVKARSFQLLGDRETVRERIARVSLQWARLAALGVGDVPLLWERPTQSVRA
jgi:nicotinamide-nucleotide amidase